MDQKLEVYTAGERVQRWYDGWEVWVDGIVESIGTLQGFPCARVWLGNDKAVTVCRLDQLQPAPLGGMFADLEIEQRPENENYEDCQTNA